jgi:hypothetical protein
MNTFLNRHVVKALADVAIFLEFTDEDLLNQDAAIEVMEQLAAELQLMNQDEKTNLSRLFDELSNDFPNARHKDFVKNLSDSLGLNAES